MCFFGWGHFFDVRRRLTYAPRWPLSLYASLRLAACQPEPAAAAVGDRAAGGGDAAAFSELLEVDDEFGSEELAELFGGLDLDGSGGSIEAGGMHPGDNG